MTGDMLCASLAFYEGIQRWLVDSSYTETVMRNFDEFFQLAIPYCWTNSGVVGDLRRHDARVM